MYTPVNPSFTKVGLKRDENYMDMLARCNDFDLSGQGISKGSLGGICYRAVLGLLLCSYFP